MSNLFRLSKTFGQFLIALSCLSVIFVPTKAMILIKKKDNNRLVTYKKTANLLQSLDDQQLTKLLEKTEPMDTDGITGSKSFLKLDDTQIFIKKLRLTDLEISSKNWESTSNLFDLPLCLQYGVGSRGFGAWRELAAHRITTNWVLNDEIANFPILYHARILKTLNQETTIEISEIDEYVQYWNNSLAIKKQVTDLQQASFELVLFLEYLPQTLDEWFEEQIDQGSEAVELALVKTENELFKVTTFMNSHNMLHFDTHFENIMTDGERLYFTDFGLVTSSQFELSHAEIAFFKQHSDYDKSYIAMEIVDHILYAVYKKNGEYQYEDSVLDACAAGNIPTEIPANMAIRLQRYAPIASLFSNFLTDMRNDKTTLYPDRELKNAWATARSLS